jgi:hypothetical protein
MVKLKIIKAGKNTHCGRSSLKIFNYNIVTSGFAIGLRILR